MGSKVKNQSPHSSMLCIYSPSYVLAVWNFLTEHPLWKFPVESANVGEVFADTVVRCAYEEAGLVLPVIRTKAGGIEKLGNDNTVKVDLVSIDRYGDHPRSFHKIRLSDSHLMSLSDKLLFADTDELLWTWAFPFTRPLTMGRFHRKHRERFEKMIDPDRYTA